MLKKLKSLISTSDPLTDTAFALYGAVVAQARQPVFYQCFGVPDDVDGRFEMIILHAFLLMRRLKDEDQEAADLSQKLYDVLFLDMDRSIREMGVSDVRIGKHMKRMMAAFHGRVQAYEEALNGAAGMAEVLRRNLYGTLEAAPAMLDGMAAYVCQTEQKMLENRLDALKNGSISYDQPKISA